MVEKVAAQDLHRVVTTCVVYDKVKDLYLIKKRRPDRMPFPGRWEVPGGGLEANDYLRQERSDDGWEDILDSVVQREVLEEVGLQVGGLIYLGNSIFIRPNDGIPVVVLRFAALYTSGEVVLDSEATEYKWIRASEASSYDLIGSIAKDIQKVNMQILW